MPRPPRPPQPCSECGAPVPQPHGAGRARETCSLPCADKRRRRTLAAWRAATPSRSDAMEAERAMRKAKRNAETMAARLSGQIETLQRKLDTLTEQRAALLATIGKG